MCAGVETDYKEKKELRQVDRVCKSASNAFPKFDRSTFLTV